MKTPRTMKCGLTIRENEDGSILLDYGWNRGGETLHHRRDLKERLIEYTDQRIDELIADLDDMRYLKNWTRKNILPARKYKGK